MPDGRGAADGGPCEMSPHEREAEARKLAARAMERMSDEERAIERDRRRVPYALSLHAMAKRFVQTGTRQGWLPTRGDAPVVLGVSGGGDSMAMLWLFRTLYEGPILVAHVEHGIRGREGEEDAAFVQRTCATWGLPCEVRRVDVPGERERGESLEAAARRARHRELVSVAGRAGAGGVALGHTRDDLAETVLFELLRGTGARGSIGIPERRGLFFRPVIDMWRDQLRDVSRVRGIRWREDATNDLTGPGQTRNFIRLELLPLIEARVNARARAHLAAFGEEMRSRRDDEEARGRSLLDDALLSSDERELIIDRARASEMSELDRALIVREAGRRLGVPTLTRRRTVELARLMARPGRFTFQWEASATVRGERHRVRFYVPRWRRSR